MSAIRRLLIANRGEIACRIARTCRRLGIEAAGVHSTADAAARHVRHLDRAVALDGPPLAAYLDGTQLIGVAKRLGCDAIHPGYGFLAESAAFAHAVEAAELVFVGPAPAAIVAMGDKAQGRAIAAAAGVPVVPGVALTKGGEAAAADALGYPLVVKPAAGGGGKGMVVVHAAAQLDPALAGARRLAAAAFGDDALIAERWLERCRHIEVQVLADGRGRVVTAFERDCSLQRRFQKIIEEAPAPGLDPDLRRQLAAAARRIAEAVAYRNLGTVEFLVAGAELYFIEMNTRLQVEHPVTEAVTGLDLAEWQLRLAAGEALPADLVPPAPLGHAIEARLYAEDPAAGFLPSTGRLTRLELPKDLVRVDSGVDVGDEVSAHFDPMIAKLVASAPTRQAALAQLIDAIEVTAVEGIQTNRDFLAEIARHPDVAAARVWTGWLDSHAGDWCFPLAPQALAALVFARHGGDRAGSAATLGFRLNAAPTVRYRLQTERRQVEAALTLDFPCHLADGRGWIECDGVRHGFGYRCTPGEVVVTVPGARRRFVPAAAALAGSATEAAGALATPLPGRVAALPAVIGAMVAAGEVLAIVEAMKMEHTIAAPFAGRVRAVLVALGDSVQEGTILVDLEELPPADEALP